MTKMVIIIKDENGDREWADFDGEVNNWFEGEILM